MRICISFVSILMLASCGGEGSLISKQLSGSDSLVINFNTPHTNNINKTVTTTEKRAIKQLVDYLDGKLAEANKCGYDGNFLFYKKGALAGDVSFNYSSEGCHHFIMDVKGKLIPATMSNQAASFLKSLSEGKVWY